MPECNGIGRKLGVDMDKFLDMSKSLNDGAILFGAYAVGKWDWNFLIDSGFFDNDKKLEDYSDEELDLLLYCEPRKVKTNVGGNSINMTFEGIISKFTNKYILKDLKTYSERTQKQVEPFITTGPCRACKGSRLSQAALSCKINGHNIAEMAAMEVGDLVGVIGEIDDPAAQSMIETLTERLQHLVDIGLEYLSLNRETDTLSGGESQRVKIVKHLSSSLVDVMYILDEPSIGLHPRDVHRLNELLQKLRDKGNTVIVVEHDPDVIKVADYIVDIGPHAGTHGGIIVFEGTFNGLLTSDTITGKHMQRAMRLKDTFREPAGKLAVKNAKANNLQNLNVDIPIGCVDSYHGCGWFG